MKQEPLTKLDGYNHVIKKFELNGFSLTEAIYPPKLRQSRHTHEVAHISFILKGGYTERHLKQSWNRKTSTLIFVLSQANAALAQSNKNSGPPKGVVKGELGAKLDRLLTRYTMYGFSGAVLAAKDGKVILNRGYGLANREENLPNTAETLFNIGSLTKQFTAAAVLRLEAQGKLNTQDLASKYLGDFPADKAGITLHHLLTHTSGLISDGANAQLASGNRDEYVEAVKKTRLRIAPGEKFYYSNVGYNLLAAVVEKVSGMPFEDYLQQTLFKRAGMKDLHTQQRARAPSCRWERL